MNDSDQIKDLPSDPHSQKKFRQQQIYIENLLNQKNSLGESKDSPPESSTNTPSAQKSHRNEPLLSETREAKGRADEVRTPPEAEARVKPEAKTDITKASPVPSMGKQLLVLATHTLMGAFLLLLILLIAPWIIAKIPWIKPSTKPFFIVGTWLVCELVVNLIFLLTKK
jgi:hypothetical protein